MNNLFLSFSIDKEGKYIGQSSPFTIASHIHLIGGENVLPKTYEYDKKFGDYDNFLSKWWFFLVMII
ncbi:hypothetical protein BHE89_17090 [Shigella sp. FC1967]|uniref:hypothetical protein n=1 Tax=Shigella sp. FC1967 TaxID=1898041 RepID=UPI00086B0B34|nr:hypothetical protein [Shigella sp. FC1967]OEJ07410.1 hypothetical protein BHE89_17090 [Shigella sp. FC1967]